MLGALIAWVIIVVLVLAVLAGIVLGVGTFRQDREFDRMREARLARQAPDMTKPRPRPLRGEDGA